MDPKITKTSLVLASPESVWSALTNLAELSTWFGAEFDAPLLPGARVSGRLVPTNVLPQVARRRRGFTGLSFTIDVERVEPSRLLSFRWSPLAFFSPDAKIAGSSRVVIEIAPDPRGSRVTVTEDDFNELPIEVTENVIKMNADNWSSQILQLELFLSGAMDLRPIKD